MRGRVRGRDAPEFVNGVAVHTVVDGVDPIPGGTVGMRAESRRESAEVEFDDFLVTRAG